MIFGCLCVVCHKDYFLEIWLKSFCQHKTSSNMQNKLMLYFKSETEHFVHTLSEVMRCKLTRNSNIKYKFISIKTESY